jgi:hypothetical protein
VAETRNDASASKAKQALREKNLKAAQGFLAEIGQDSVYFASLRDDYTKVENAMADDARRRAVGLANAHDCASLRRYLQQLNASSTERVFAMASTVKCSDGKTAAPAEPAVKAGPGSATVALPTPPPTTPANPCATMNVEDVMSQAANQFSAGFPKPALALISKALQCKQDVRMYRFAAMYACAAHDLASAKLYFNKLPAQFQPGVEQRCQQENMNIRGP